MPDEPERTLPLNDTSHSDSLSSDNQSRSNLDSQNSFAANPEPVPATPEVADTPPEPQLVETTPETPNSGWSPEPIPSVEAEPTTASAEQSAFGNTPDPQPANAVPQPSVAPSSPKKSKKKYIIGGVIALVLALLIAGGVLAYNLWYQNPQKVLTDAMVNAVTAKSVGYDGTFSAEIKPSGSSGSETIKYDVSFDGMSEAKKGYVNVSLTAEGAGKTIKISGNGLFADNGDIYVKVKGLSELLTSVFGSASLPASYSSFVTKIDDKWIKISSKELSDLDASTQKSKDCSEKLLEKTKTDKSLVKEVGDVYRSNQFIVVKDKLPSKNGSLGYSISGDKSVYKSFVSGVEKTSLYKQAKECNGNSLDLSSFLGSADSSSSSDTKSTMEVYVGRWSHNLTSLKVADTGKDTTAALNVNTNFNKDVKVDIPSTSMSISDLKAEIEKVQAEYIQSLYGGYSTSTTPSTSMLPLSS